MQDVSGSLCALCQISLNSSKICFEEKLFCCHGCQAVYGILESISALEGFERHPVFQQAVKFGLISNPELLQQLQKNQSEKPTQEKRKWQLEIHHMWCPSCADLIKLILMRLKGVSQCVIDYATDLASIEYYPQNISKADIQSVICSLGYVPKELTESYNNRVPKQLYVRFLVAAFCAFNVMMFAYPLYAIYFSAEKEATGGPYTVISLLFSLPVVTYCAYPIFRRCFHGLKVGFWGMESLISLGVLSSFCLSIYQMGQGSIEVYFDSMTVIVAFVLLGKIIETKAKFSSKEVLFRLNRSLPQKARKHFANGNEGFVLTKEIRKGDLISVHTGEKIIFDGFVRKGQGACDESMMTGESLPVSKQEGVQVLAGTLVQSGSFLYEVTHLAKESSIQKIITLIESEIGRKTSNVRFGDTIAQYFTPIVVLLALLTFICFADKREGMLAAVSVLLISCPCALGIAAPLAESHLILQLAQLGAIVRNRNALHFLGQESVCVFDKTGTITEGKFRVIRGLEVLDEQQRRVMKTMTLHSGHPLSFAIGAALVELPMDYASLEEIPGRGIRARIREKEYLLGSQRFLKEEGVILRELEHLSLTPVLFAEEKVFITSLLLEDSIKEEAKALRKILKDKRIILLSGDHQSAVQNVAKQLGFNEWRGNVTPFEKKAFIENLKQQGEIVLMVGDGINDAPAITTAHVGVSVVSASDISIQVSDILLTSLSLHQLPQLMELGKKGQKILKQNFFWAFFYNIIGIGLAMTSQLSPIFAAFAMTASSLVVLFNSKRIRN
ncbi:Heavy metal translocating P-type ATPase [Chlamydiales bacterium STE3]|nr:Heavy metal translocating P-type ATPase [Chlamydiales bacterium STE3]